MSEERCKPLASQYREAAKTCFVTRRSQFVGLGVEQAQENFLQCIAAIPDPDFQACARGEQKGPSCNCGGIGTAGSIPVKGKSIAFRKC